MENRISSSSEKMFSVIGIGNPSIDIIGTIESKDVSLYKLIEGKTNHADDFNIALLENFEKNQDFENLLYLPSGSVINTIKVINVKYKKLHFFILVLK